MSRRQCRVRRDCVKAGRVSCPTVVEPPCPPRTLGRVIPTDRHLRITTEFLERTNLLPLLNTAPSLTVFAPTDAAWRELGPTKLKFLVDNPNVAMEVLKYHVLGESVATQVLSVGSPGSRIMLDGSEMLFFATSLQDTQGRAGRIVVGNESTVNGLLNTLDRVMLPFKLP